MASKGTLNKIMLIGHTGDDVKLHYFDDGGCIGNFPLATNESYINKTTGEQVTNTEWHRIVVRNKAAEVCEKYLKKGDKAYIEGRIKTRKWQDREGRDRYTTEVQCLDFTFLTPKGQSGMNRPSQGADTQPAPSQPQPEQGSNPSSDEGVSEPGFEEDDEEDDLPF